MARFITDDLTPMQAGRLAKALDSLIRVDGVVMTQRERLAPLSGRKKETDNMAAYNRVRFNGMTQRDQEAYMARLRGKRVYMVAVPLAGYDGDAWSEVPKVIYDAIAPDVDPGEAEAEAAWSPADSVALFGVA